MYVYFSFIFFILDYTTSAGIKGSFENNKCTCTHTEQGSRIIKFNKMGEHFFWIFFVLLFVAVTDGRLLMFSVRLSLSLCVVFSRVYTWAAEAELDESGGKTGTNITNC